MLRTLGVADTVETTTVMLVLYLGDANPEIQTPKRLQKVEPQILGWPLKPSEYSEHDSLKSNKEEHIMPQGLPRIVPCPTTESFLGTRKGIYFLGSSQRSEK